MRFFKFAASAAIAIAGLFAAVSGAFAYDAAATTALNVRTGPGTSYRVVAALSPNQIVQVGQCNSSNTWCEVTANNIRGWASARYLRPLGPTTPTRPRPGASAGPDVGFSINTPNFNLSIGQGRPNVRPTPRGQVCFFEDYDYKGRSFCASGDENQSYVGNFWSGRIYSARVNGNVSATVCSGPNFTGRCAVVDRSVRNLGVMSGEIASFYMSGR